MSKQLLLIEQSEPNPLTVVITLTGSILLGPESECIEALVRQSIEQGKQAVVFDLTAVKKIDSTGIGRFISAYHLLQKANGAMRMVAGPGLVRKSFQATRLETVFGIAASLREALESLKK